MEKKTEEKHLKDARKWLGLEDGQDFPADYQGLKGDTETKPEQSSSKKEVDNRQISESEKPHKSWWQRIF